MRIGMMEWQNIVNEMATEFENAGAIRQTGCQIWNKEGVFRIGYLFEYENEKAYKDCQEIWKETESKMKAEQAVKVFANRGIVIVDEVL